MIEEFERLIAKGDTDSAYQLACRACASDEEWCSFLEQHPDYARAAATNTTTGSSVRRLLAVHPDPEVRFEVAAKKIPDDLYPLLARDEDESVRLKIATNRHVPQEVLESLRTDPWEHIREHVERVLEERRTQSRRTK